MAGGGDDWCVPSTAFHEAHPFRNMPAYISDMPAYQMSCLELLVEEETAECSLECDAELVDWNLSSPQAWVLSAEDQLEIEAQMKRDRESREANEARRQRRREMKQPHFHFIEHEGEIRGVAQPPSRCSSYAPSEPESSYYWNAADTRWICDTCHRMPHDPNLVYHNGLYIHLIVNERNLKAWFVDPEAATRAPEHVFHSLLFFLPAPEPSRATPAENIASLMDKMSTNVDWDMSSPAWLLVREVRHVLDLLDSLDEEEVREAVARLPTDPTLEDAKSFDDIVDKLRNFDIDNREASPEDGDDAWADEIVTQVDEFIATAAAARAHEFMECYDTLERQRDRVDTLTRLVPDQPHVHSRLRAVSARATHFLDNDDCLPVPSCLDRMMEWDRYAWEDVAHVRPEWAGECEIGVDELEAAQESAKQRALAAIRDSRRRLVEGECD